MSAREREHVKQSTRPRVPVVYEVIRQEGEAELARPAWGLWWSGLAAGICIGFSLLSEALLRAHLPEVGWRPLLENLGYTVGFLLVILGRQQLFTENTVTAVLPIMAHRTRAKLGQMVRLWSIVLAANLVGAFVFAAFLVTSGAVSIDLMAAMQDISNHMLALSAWDKFWRGVVAGWLIATLVWILPHANGASVFMIILITYLIALGEFTHIVAGSVEAFLALLTASISLEGVVLSFLIPTLFGNIVGGTVLFAMLSHAQVQSELQPHR
ncbi:MAG: formate/nitrite transporter family protein [Rhodospirillales bacterium]|nr:formate/nitrite transporter family protein [Rhodospirillales bacterium]